jgi:hypothetical protein
MDDRMHCLGALALEVSPEAAAEVEGVAFQRGRSCLDRAAAASLLEPVLLDLQRLLPGADVLDLGLAMACFDPAELLRPGWPVFAAVGDLLAGAPGERGQSRIVSLWGSDDGRMPVPALQPDANLLGGPMRVLPFVLHGAPEHIAVVGELMEADLIEKGMASAATALAAQRAFELPLEHARYLSLHDLCALTALQYEHAGLAPVWRLLEAALFTPQAEEWVEEAGEPPALFARGQALIGLPPAHALHAEAAAADVSAERMARLRGMRARQWQAVLGAHGIEAELVELSGSCAAELESALRRH